MNNLIPKTLLIAILLSFGLTSCHQDRLVTPAPITTGLFVLNQGKFNSNNSTLTYFVSASRTATTDYFSAVNGSTLGDTGNDIEIYGNKMYIVVNVTSTLEIVDAHSAKSIKKISMVNGITARKPRNIVFYKGNAYITSYDNTVAVLDTASLTISKYITVGNNPEQLTVANGKIYVANSGGFSPTFDNTVSVIDPASNTVIKTLTVGVNPLDVTTDNNGHVFVLSLGDYNTIGSQLTVINDNTDVAASPANFDASFFTVQGTTGYFITDEGKVGTYNTNTQSIASSNFITDGTSVTTPFAVAVNSLTGEVYICDAKDYSSNGQVFAFDKTGKKEYVFNTGVNPGRIAFVKN